MGSFESFQNAYVLYKFLPFLERGGSWINNYPTHHKLGVNKQIHKLEPLSREMVKVKKRRNQYERSNSIPPITGWLS